MNPNHMKSVFLGGAALAVLAVGGAGPVSARDTAAAEQPDSAALEYVIPGTSARTKAMLVTSSVSSVTGDEVSIPSANINNMLYGRIPGLVVSQTNGEPGYDAATLSIRGVATYNNSSLPVYVDGFQTNMAYFQFLSPAEIDRIEVLKDAAALAPFGMRGANGVIWVTTKRGRIGRPRVTVNVRGGVQQPMNLQNPLRTGDYTRLYNEALSNDNGNVWTPYYTADQVARLPDVDWYREVTKKATPYTDADVSVSGGDKTVRYFVLFGYMGQRGIYDTPTNDTLANAGIDRYNIRTNLDMNPSARGYNNLVLSEIFPAGWEILNTRFLNESATDSLSAGVNYQDIRDDRVYSYIDRLPAGSQVTVKINLCAVYPGRFYLPPVYCEAMYDYLIRANTAGQEVTVF